MTPKLRLESSLACPNAIVHILVQASKFWIKQRKPLRDIDTTKLSVELSTTFKFLIYLFINNNTSSKMVDRYSLVILLLCFVYNARSQDSNYCSISPSHTLCQFTVRILRVFSSLFFKSIKNPTWLDKCYLKYCRYINQTFFSKFGSLGPAMWYIFPKTLIFACLFEIALVFNFRTLLRKVEIYKKKLFCHWY